MNDLLWAKKHFERYCPRYEKYERYYQGDQPLAFVSKKIRSIFGELFGDFCDNQCKQVVDIFSARVQLFGFSSENEDLTAYLEDIYKINKLDLNADRIHTEAIKEGDSYAIVWPNEQGVATIYPQKTRNIAVRYEDNGDREEIVEACKSWLQEVNGQSVRRVTRYMPDRIERYVTPEKKFPDSTAVLRQYTDDGQPPVIVNPYGVIPIFHFSNAADPDDFAMSELKPVIPIQNALNKCCVDLLVAMEFNALPQRWATGLEVPIDGQNQSIEVYKAATDRLWMNSSPDAKFGEFPATDLQQFLAIQDNYRQEICRVTSTPAHLLFLSGQFPSGEALKTASEPLTTKVNAACEVWGETWENLMRFACLISGRPITEEITCVWKDTSPQSQKDQADVAIKKQSIGVSDEQLQREFGYSTEQIEQMQEENATRAASVSELAVQAFNAGGVNVNAAA